MADDIPEDFPTWCYEEVDRRVEAEKARDPHGLPVRWLKQAFARLIHETQPEPDPLVEALFDAIKHGDDEHQRWLRNALYKFAAKNPLRRGIELAREGV